MPIILLTQERGDPVLINSDWIVFGASPDLLLYPGQVVAPLERAFS